MYANSFSWSFFDQFYFLLFCEFLARFFSKKHQILQEFPRTWQGKQQDVGFFAKINKNAKITARLTRKFLFILAWWTRVEVLNDFAWIRHCSPVNSACMQERAKKHTKTDHLLAFCLSLSNSLSPAKFCREHPDHFCSSLLPRKDLSENERLCWPGTLLSRQPAFSGLLPRIWPRWDLDLPLCYQSCGSKSSISLELLSLWSWICSPEKKIDMTWWRAKRQVLEIWNADWKNCSKWSISQLCIMNVDFRILASFTKTANSSFESFQGTLVSNSNLLPGNPLFSNFHILNYSTALEIFLDICRYKSENNSKIKTCSIYVHRMHVNAQMNKICLVYKFLF